MALKNEEDRIRLLREQREFLKEEIQLLNIQKSTISSIGEQEEINKEIQENISKIREINLQLNEKDLTVQEKINRSIKNQIKDTLGLGVAAYSLSRTVSSIWTTMMGVDKAIKSTTLTLGFAGKRADILRQTFESTAGYAARLGGTYEDLGIITTSFADEVGRARVLSGESYKTILAMGKGTSLGVEQASRLAGKFEMIGIDVRTAGEYVTGVIETSERMGISAGKVLENINKNFSRLRTFTFVQGVKGFSQMATYAEKMRIDVGQAMDVAEKGRRLDNAIEMAAQLQVLGGEFSKMDGLEILNLSRNDPAELTKRINEMTKGIVTFRKNSEGVFEKFISPADRDRVVRMAEVLGIQTEEIMNQAHKMAEIQKFREQIGGRGLTAKERDLIEGIGVFNSQTGKFQIQLGKTVKDVKDLTNQQIRSFAEQAKSLEDRGLAAQTFDEALKNTMEELKTVLLPLLKGVNHILNTIRPYAIKITEWLAGISDASKNFISFVGGGLLLIKGATMLLKATGLATLGKYLGKGVASVGKKIFTKTPKPLPTMGGGAATQAVTGRDGKPLNAGAMRAWQTGQLNHANKMTTIEMARQKSELKHATKMVNLDKTRAQSRNLRGAGHLKTGAGIGAAGLGIGAGIGVAALGIGQLAKSMEGLSDRKAELLRDIAMTLAISFPLGAIGMVAFGKAGAAVAPALYKVGGAMLMIGGAIGIAAAGIGYMVNSFSKIIEVGGGVGSSFFEMSKGIGLIAISLAGLGMMGGSGAIGLVLLNSTLNRIGKHAPMIREVGDAFKQINAVLSGSYEDFERIERMITKIASVEIKDKSAFAELSSLLKTPLRVKFDDKEVAFIANVTLDIDGETLFKNIGGRKIATIQENTRINKPD